MEVLLGKPEADIALYFGIVLAVAFVFFLPLNLLCKKFGLKAMMMFSLVIFAVLLPFIYFLGQPMFSLSPDTFALILMALLGIPVAAIFVVPDAIVAAVSDLEAKLSGQRREAMYFGAQGFVLKLALGVSTIITGGLLQFFGSTAAEPLGFQLTGPVSALFMIIGIIVFTRYPEREVAAYQEADSISA